MGELYRTIWVGMIVCRGAKERRRLGSLAMSLMKRQLLIVDHLREQQEVRQISMIKVVMNQCNLVVLLRKSLRSQMASGYIERPGYPL